jgi:hypothetical protein
LQGKVSLVSADGITQLNIFIFVLAAFHVLCCIITLTLSRAKACTVSFFFFFFFFFLCDYYLEQGFSCFVYCCWNADEEMEEMGNRDDNI